MQITICCMGVVKETDDQLKGSTIFDQKTTKSPSIQSCGPTALRKRIFQGQQACCEPDKSLQSFSSERSLKSCSHGPTCVVGNLLPAEFNQTHCSHDAYTIYNSP
ncbi:hypothetical protein AVEN_148484-1 [Araneus ventricosus]|uniref:Uncharacterized protein n=1 Tax=Araneus ventricosus TaxID=182803 RepID=A0A4Y2SP49_ARAVE|nr:hypothetical protein AVEN_148484-1 [Araneus ventricosus]